MLIQSFCSCWSHWAAVEDLAASLRTLPAYYSCWILGHLALELNARTLHLHSPRGKSYSLAAPHFSNKPWRMPPRRATVVLGQLVCKRHLRTKQPQLQWPSTSLGYRSDSSGWAWHSWGATMRKIPETLPYFPSSPPPQHTSEALLKLLVALEVIFEVGETHVGFVNDVGQPASIRCSTNMHCGNLPLKQRL